MLSIACKKKFERPNLRERWSEKQRLVEVVVGWWWVKVKKQQLCESGFIMSSCFELFGSNLDFVDISWLDVEEEVAAEAGEEDLGLVRCLQWGFPLQIFRLCPGKQPLYILYATLIFHLYNLS